MKKNIELTILIPCLNEEITLPVCIKKAFDFISSNKISGEVLVVDNNSIDHSRSIAKKLGARVIIQKNKGYGSALRYGIQNAYGKYIIMADADDSYNFLEIEPILLALKDGYDFVIGNRFQGIIEKNAMPFLHRYIGTPAITTIGNILYRTKIGDYNCGLRGLNKDKFQNLKFQTTGMEFASEMIIVASKNNLTIKEIPVNLYKDKRNRKPHLNTIKDGMRHLKVLLKGIISND